MLPASAGYPPAFQTAEGTSVAADGAVPNPLFASGDREPSAEAAGRGSAEAGADAGRSMPTAAVAESSAHPSEGLGEDHSPGAASPRKPSLLPLLLLHRSGRTGRIPIGWGPWTAHGSRKRQRPLNVVLLVSMGFPMVMFSS